MGREVAIDQHLKIELPLHFVQRSAKRGNGAGHRQHRGPEDVELVDLFHVSHANRPTAAAFELHFQNSALVTVELFGIVEPSRARLAQDHSGSHHWSRQRATPSLVHADCHTPFMLLRDSINCAQFMDAMFKKPALTVLLPVVALAASCGISPGGESPAEAQSTDALATDAPATDARAAQVALATALAIKDLARFNEPWAMAFIPGTPFVLVTEKSGRLKLWREGADPVEVSGAPAVDYGGQGGLGDVAVSPRFAEDRMVYLSWVEAGPADTRGAVVGRARLVWDGTPRLEGLTVIWRQNPKVTGRGHYSHRLAFSPDGQFLFVASGDRQKKTPSQDLTGNLGKILRLLPDGRPAPGNPFTDKGGVTAEIWSLGHRNALGLQFDAAGKLWTLEHGPAGGDELNLVEPGRNYGWPVVSNGDNYDGSRIPRHSTRPEFAQPAISWSPVIAPGDFAFYTGRLFKDWQGQAIIAGMGFPGLVRVAIDGTTAREVERIDLGHRIREVRVGPDGAVLVLEDGPDGRLRRITPR